MLDSRKGIMSMVAVILVNYNGYEDTIRCLQSFREVRYKNYCIYIVDNGSTNNSYSVLKEYCGCNKDIKTKIIKSTANLGFSGGNNIGIKDALSAGADYILLLNNDTVVTPDFLDILVGNADENTIVAPRMMYWKDKNIVWYAGGQLSKIFGRAWHNNINKELDSVIDTKHKEVTFISGCCMLIHREIFNKIGLLEEKYFLYYEDTEYCWRALNNGIRLYYVGDSVIFHNVSSSTGHNSCLMNYYKIRNRMYLIKEYVNGRKKITSFLLAHAEIVIGILIRKYQFEAVKAGIKDYKAGIVGRKKD